MSKNRFDRDRSLVETANVCPYFKLLGMEAIHLREGYARVRLQIEEKHYQNRGTVHGGVITSLLDAAGAMAAFSSIAPEDDMVTAEMKVNFLSGPKTGETVIAEGRVVQSGRTLVLAEMEARTEDGRLVAKATETCVVLRGALTG